MDELTTADMFLFDDFRLDRRGLSRRDRSGAFVPVVIGSRALEILAVLVARPGEIVSRDEIIQKVWPATIVEYSNIAVQIASLRRALDDGRTNGNLIQTVPGRGYRFAGTVSRAPPAAAPSLPDKPSIAVLPFINMSGDPEQEYFADGMVEEIITALSRIRWLFVIARNSSFAYKGQAVDVKQVGCELGVRYVLEGSVRKARQRVRIAAQLIDATSGAHLWADRFDGSLEDVFDLQDKVASSVAGVIEPTLQAAEIRRSSERPTGDLTAYDLYLRALPDWGSREKQRIVRALDLLGQAIERDPQYGPAFALAAHCHQQLEVRGWIEDPEAVRLTSVGLARQALRVGPDDPDVLGRVAVTFGYFGEDIGVAIGLIDRCLALNPSYANAWHWRGLLRVFAGQPERALDDFQNYLRLSPRDRITGYMNSIGEAYFFCRRFDEAAAHLLGSLERGAPSWPASPTDAGLRPEPDPSPA